MVTLFVVCAGAVTDTLFSLWLFPILLALHEKQVWDGASMQWRHRQAFEPAGTACACVHEIRQNRRNFNINIINCKTELSR